MYFLIWREKVFEIPTTINNYIFCGKVLSQIKCRVYLFADLLRNKQRSMFTSLSYIY